MAETAAAKKAKEEEAKAAAAADASKDEQSEPLLDKTPEDSELTLNERLNNVWVELTNGYIDNPARATAVRHLEGLQLAVLELEPIE